MTVGERRAATARRTELLWLSLLVSNRRSARKQHAAWYDHQIGSQQRRLGAQIDREWLERELRAVSVAAEPWPAGAYERWRREGMPLWALLAAGCRPRRRQHDDAVRRPPLP